ncbi:MAG TPA: iron ABC transporter substrate-binding protein [Syntrophobacteraceae bacterium]|nr:iron ABC transporter substrate-binding protein [Syntrophobacteraceae bacterium]
MNIDSWLVGGGWRQRVRRTAIGILWWCAGFLLFHPAAVHAGPVVVTDDWGQTIQLPGPAQRIIPLYGAFAEMLFAIGAGPQVVARTDADQEPPEVTRLPAVGTHMRPNVEMIVALKPNLVVQSASRRVAMPEIQRVVEAGIPVAVFSPNSFDDIFRTMKRLGVLAGHEEAAAQMEQNMRQRLQDVAARLAATSVRPRVFFEVRAEPLSAAGRGSMVQHILDAVKAENVVEGDKAIVQTDLEMLLLANPDYYVVQQGPMNRNPVPPGERQHFQRLRAVQHHRVILVDEYLFSRAGPRCVDAVEQLAAALYPERFSR